MAYGAAVAARNAAYDHQWLKQARLPARVVSVGNVTVGGAGKTACIELIAKKLTADGRRVAILSRGYGGLRRAYWLRVEGGRLCVNGDALAAADGLADEPQLLALSVEGTPVVVGADRARTGAWAVKQFRPDVLLLDDGFQHRRLHRDCDVVLVHARMPLGGWALLPRGPMREPLSALQRAQVVVMTKVDEAWETSAALAERLRSFNRHAVLATAVHEPTAVVDTSSGERHEPRRLAGRRVGLLSSIGDPDGFEATVKRLHATILWHRAFPDHHRYTQADVAWVLDEANRTRPDVVLTTQKDHVRLRPWTTDQGPGTVPLWVLGVRMRIVSGEAELDARLAALHTR